MVLKSAVEGASYINIEAGTSNFTDVVGLTETQWAADGSITSAKLLTAAQELGKNAIVSINGTDVTSTSNTVTADVSRITGLTLNLKSVSTEESGTSTLVIEQDMTKLSSALNDVISAYNELMSTVDKNTSVEGALHGETALKMVYSNMRNSVNSASVNDGMYSLLSQIGISTAAASTAMEDDTVSLTLDEDKLKSVLANNGDSVKELLIGDNGIFANLKSTVDNALYSGGYFKTKESSMNIEVENMQKKITRRQESVASYQARLESKFSAMETVISKLNSNYTSLMNM